MKKQLLSIFLFSLAITSFAQITITNNDIVPVGTTVYLANDETFTTGITPGDPGTNMIWDFYNVVASTTDTLSFILPSSTPYPNVFPLSNFAFTTANPDIGNVFAYMNRNEDKLSYIGNVLESEEMGNVTNTISPENIIIDFPANYLNVYNETYTSEMRIGSPTPGIDSLRTFSTIEKTTIIDAWGSITTPVGTYNALRQNVNENQIDSTFMKMAGMWVFVDASIDNTTTYSWWTNDISVGFTLFSITFDELASEITGISFFNGSIVGINETTTQVANVFPNPTRNITNFEFNETVSGKISVSNQLGQIVVNHNFNNKIHMQIDMSNLPQGVYIYQVISNNKNIVSTGKLIKR